MTHFQPSRYSVAPDAYGYWGEEYVNTFWDWLTGKAQDVVPNQLAAAGGLAAGPEIYATIEAKYFAAPSNLAEAYERAIEWLSIGARRADYAGNKTAQATLLKAAANLKAAAIRYSFSVPGACLIFGIGCPEWNPTSVYTYAIQAVEGSGLAAEDVAKIDDALKSALTRIRFRHALPFLALGVVVAGGAYYAAARRRNSKGAPK